VNDKLLEEILNFVLNNMGNRESMHLNHYIQTRADYWNENAKLKEALREAVQTLEFYARVNNWHTDGVVLHCMDVISVSDTEYCSINEKYGGRRAREFQSKHAAIIAEINPPTMGDK